MLSSFREQWPASIDQAALINGSDSLETATLPTLHERQTFPKIKIACGHRRPKNL